MTHNLFDLRNKVALISGASRGLGQAMASGLAEAGADIIALSTSKENLTDTENHIKKTGRRIYTFSCDMNNYKQVDYIVDEVKNIVGGVDILVNNAAITHRSAAQHFSDHDWADVINTNLNATFHLSREVAKIMLARQSGKIINMASVLSFRGGDSVAAYAASKGGVRQLTRALANEWAKYKIQVNAIAPGYFITEMTEPLIKEDKKDGRITERIPAGRWGIAQDLIGTVVFLASSASNYVNGHILVVDGGWLAR